MTPIIRPLPIPRDPPTEYEKEREIFAAMQAEFRTRQPAPLAFFRRLAARLRPGNTSPKCRPEALTLRV